MNNLFKYVLLISAISVSVIGGYFSVWGLSQLFAGASTSVIVMASVLEFGKIITTVSLHRYWNKLALGIKTYLTISVIVLMLITSGGIYGFLSNAYQQTANKLELHQGETSVLENKKELFNKNIKNNEEIINNKNKRISILTNLRVNQESRLDSAKNTKSRDRVRSDISEANLEIQRLTNEIDILNSKSASLSDSTSYYDNKILILNSKSDAVAEVGPLKYLSKLTNLPMDRVVNYFILLLIFVFDPLAIALVIVTNRVFQLSNEDKSIDKVKESVTNTTINETLELIKYDSNEYDKQIEDLITDVIPNDEYGEELVEDPNEESFSEHIPQEPVIPNGKINREDIKEIKEINRGFSVKVPTPKKAQIERIGSNKVIKNNNSNKIYFDRNKK